MADGTAFMVSKEEYALIEKFKQAKEEGLYDTEEELWNDYKKTILRKRENKIKDQKYAEEIAKIDKRIENKKEVVTQTTKEEKTLDATITQTTKEEKTLDATITQNKERIENKKEVVTQTTKEEKTLDATIIQTKEIAAAEKESLNRELEKANQQIDEQIKKWA
jgi:predicted RND superfamily exporter protein